MCESEWQEAQGAELAPTVCRAMLEMRVVLLPVGATIRRCRICARAELAVAMVRRCAKRQVDAIVLGLKQ